MVNYLDKKLYSLPPPAPIAGNFAPLSPIANNVLYIANNAPIANNSQTRATALAGGINKPFQSLQSLLNVALTGDKIFFLSDVTQNVSLNTVLTLDFIGNFFSLDTTLTINQNANLRFIGFNQITFNAITNDVTALTILFTQINRLQRRSSTSLIFLAGSGGVFCNCNLSLININVYFESNSNLPIINSSVVNNGLMTAGSLTFKNINVASIQISNNSVSNPVPYFLSNTPNTIVLNIENCFFSNRLGTQTTNIAFFVNCIINTIRNSFFNNNIVFTGCFFRTLQNVSIIENNEFMNNTFNANVLSAGGLIGANLIFLSNKFFALSASPAIFSFNADVTSRLIANNNLVNVGTSLINASGGVVPVENNTIIADISFNGARYAPNLNF